MRVTLAQNRDKTKNVALHPEGLAVSADKSFAREFGRAIQRSLDGKRAVFRGWEYFGFTIDRAGWTEGYTVHAILSHRFKNVEGGECILLKVLRRTLSAITNVSIGSKMDDKVCLLNGIIQSFRVNHIALYKLKARWLKSLVQKLMLARRKVVVTSDCVSLLQ